MSTQRHSDPRHSCVRQCPGSAERDWPGHSCGSAKHREATRRHVIAHPGLATAVRRDGEAGQSRGKAKQRDARAKPVKAERGDGEATRGSASQKHGTAGQREAAARRAWTTLGDGSAPRIFTGPRQGKARLCDGRPGLCDAEA